MDDFDFLFYQAVSSMESCFKRKEYHLAATYGQIASNYAWLFEAYKSEKEGDKSEKTD